jgi:hypothetical protein
MYSNFNRGNSIVVSGAASIGYNEPIVLVKDAYAMDLKIDDGLPYLGKILSNADNIENQCVATPLSSFPSHITSTYLVNQPTDTCVMYFALSNYIFR